MKSSVYSSDSIKEVYGTIYNVMIVRKALGEYLLLEIHTAGIPIEDVLERSGFKKDIFHTMLLGSSMGTVKKNHNLEGYWKIAKSIPITKEQFHRLLKKSVVQDNAKYNQAHISPESVYIGYFHPPKENHEGYNLRAKIHG